MSFKSFVLELNKTKTEEEVKYSYAKHFGIKYDTSSHFDLYTPQVLFEFKYHKNFQNLMSRAAVLAQSLYYVHRLKYGWTDKQIPPFICLADKNEVILSETIQWKDYYTDPDEKYDWDLAPSIPDVALIKDLAKSKELKIIHIYKITTESEYKLIAEKLSGYLCAQLSLPLADKKLITEDNFENVYEYWNLNFGEEVRNGLKSSRYFISDIQKNRTYLDKKENKVIFIFEGGENKIKKILLHKYEYFWSIYEKVDNSDLIKAIYAKLDRLTDEELRRFQGEYFTPIKFAKKGLDYLEKTLGKQWWKKNFRIWDMAAGTGNLQYYLPNEAYKYTYLSTIHHEDIVHCRKLFPDSTIFQYDYLNDDVENIFREGTLPFEKNWKLPENLLHDLTNPDISWVIFINPPFATSQTAGTKGKKSKKDVSDTLVRKVMHKQNLGEVSRELFLQFLFRIKNEFIGKKTYLGLFSKLKYINANNDQRFRDEVFHFVFERGFMFSSINFSGTSKASQFPVGFLIWNLNETKKIELQEIKLDIFDSGVQKLGRKHVQVEHRDKFLSKWITRPAGISKFPPFGSSINIKRNNKDARDRISKDFLGSLMCCGNDLQHQNFTSLLSGPYVSAGAHSITPEIFEKSLVVHSVRRLPEANWINDRDQFMSPNKKLSETFITNCVIWSLFSNSNDTVALKDVVYKKTTYQIQNHFFPFSVCNVNSWNISDTDIKATLINANNRFVAEWINNRRFSDEASEVLLASKSLYKYYFEHLNELDTNKFKIHTWDAGWWQIRKVLSDGNTGKDLLDDLKAKHNKLKEEIVPEIYNYGFLS